jgi:RNA polymerase sigma-70 factor (ECF subfamily)
MLDREASAEIVRQAAAGDAVALKVLLVDSHEPLRAQLARRIPAQLQSAIAVDDIVQEAHIEVFRRIRSFKPEGPGSFDRWLVTIALSRLRNALQRQRTLKRGGGWQPLTRRAHQWDESTLALLDTLAGPGRTPSRDAARQETIVAVHNALAALPEQYRQALWLVRIEGRSVAEAAADMRRTERAVHGLCRRGLVLLRAQLKSADCFLNSDW